MQVYLVISINFGVSNISCGSNEIQFWNIIPSRTLKANLVISTAEDTRARERRGLAPDVRFSYKLFHLCSHR